MQMLTQNIIDSSWQWLCQSRKHFPANTDIWHLRHHRAHLLPHILQSLRSGHYRFSPMLVIPRKHEADGPIWNAADAFVLKIMTQILQGILPLHKSCTHIKGHGGHKYAVRQAHQWIAGKAYPFVCKMDIRQYYANINKYQLFDQLCRYVTCPTMRNLLSQFLFYSVEKGGNFHTPIKGIPRSSPLSALLAGFHLYELDLTLSQQKGIRYLRFMDDLLILCQTRWQLRHAVRTMNQWLEAARLTQHPDKTYIGRVSHGFDWLGYHFDQSGLRHIAKPALDKHLIKLRQLYEQARKRFSERETLERMAGYIKRWRRWCNAGLLVYLAPQYYDGDDIIHSSSCPWISPGNSFRTSAGC